MAEDSRATRPNREISSPCRCTTVYHKTQDQPRGTPNPHHILFSFLQIHSCSSISRPGQFLIHPKATETIRKETGKSIILLILGEHDIDVAIGSHVRSTTRHLSLHAHNAVELAGVYIYPLSAICLLKIMSFKKVVVVLTQNKLSSSSDGGPTPTSPKNPQLAYVPFLPVPSPSLHFTLHPTTT